MKNKVQIKKNRKEITPSTSSLESKKGVIDCLKRLKEAGIIVHTKHTSSSRKLIPVIRYNYDMYKKLPKKEAMQKAVDRFNEDYKSGDKVHLLDDNNVPFEATVSHGAVVLSGHTPMVYLEGIGAYLLNRVVILKRSIRRKPYDEEKYSKLAKSVFGDDKPS